MKVGKGKAREEELSINKKASRAKRWAFIRRTPTFLNWFESPKILKIIKPYIKTGQVIADIGCGWGYYTGIPRSNNYTHIFIQTGDNVGWDLLKFCVVFTISDNFLAINFTNPNIRHGFSCLS